MVPDPARPDVRLSVERRGVPQVADVSASAPAARARGVGAARSSVHRWREPWHSAASCRKPPSTC
jgi:hypothetical protein